MKKIYFIFLESLPILFMIALIPVIQNDYWLLLAYAGVIALAFYIKYTPKDFLVLGLGVLIMTIFEYIFISTGVEIFLRNSLFQKMPIWLPLLWGYGFVAIKRVVLLL